MEAELSRAACLTEETLAAFIGGELSANAIGRVEAHLAGCADCRTIVADAAFGAIGTEDAEGGAAVTIHQDSRARYDVAATIADADPPPARALSRGDLVGGKHLVEEWLGGGGMGDVFAARHVDLGHRVAIKVLRYAGPTALVRFFREARLCARLTTEHVPRVYDVGRLPSGAPFLVMEILIGKDLSRQMAEGPVPIADAVRHAIQICAGLQAAHSAGIVHRDVKPANIFLVTRDGADPLIKVLDFGISKISTDGDPASAQGLTVTGAVMGSPLYMSPEQVRASQDIDARTDIWSLGVILYELVTGRTPFRQPTISALALAIATEAPAPPSALCSSLPKALEAVILKCLEKDRNARFASIDEVAARLAAIASGSPEVASEAAASPANAARGERLPSSPRAPSRLWLRSWKAAGAAVAAAAALIVALVAARGTASRTSAPPPHASAPPPANGAIHAAAPAVPVEAPPPKAAPEPTAPAPGGKAPTKTAKKPQNRTRRHEVPDTDRKPAGPAPASVPPRAIDPLDTPD